MMEFETPVLILGFNRPETTRRVFDVVKQIKPRHLFLATDGPRASRPEEANRCAAVRQIIADVDWPCEVRTLFRQENLGCKMAVSAAITWFFENVQEGIIIEDDCLPDPSFFRYCAELLAYHRGDPRIMGISGDNFVSTAWQSPDSYYFSRFMHIWGWATWRRAWCHYDVQMRDWSTTVTDDILAQTFPHAPKARKFWRNIITRVARGEIDTWDYQWLFACWKRQGMICIPAVNLISNIGFGAGATHTHDAEAKLANLRSEPIEFPLRHPRQVQIAEQADEWTRRNIFDIDETPFGFDRISRAVDSKVRRVLGRFN